MVHHCRINKKNKANVIQQTRPRKVGPNPFNSRGKYIVLVQ